MLCVHCKADFPPNPSYPQKVYCSRRCHNAAKNRRSRGRAVAFIKAAKDVPCQECGKRYPAPVMEFHHVRGKSFTISEHARNRPLAVVKAEVAKAVVLCCLCHRLRTHALIELPLNELGIALEDGAVA